MFDTSVFGVVNDVERIFTELDAVPIFIGEVVVANNACALPMASDTMVLGVVNDVERIFTALDDVPIFIGEVVVANTF